MPAEFRFDAQAGSSGSFVAEDEDTRIKHGTMVRLKICGLRLASREADVVRARETD